MPNRQRQFEQLDGPQYRGDATEALVTAEFTLRGETVLKPISDNEPFDFVLRMNDSWERIQSKTAYDRSNGTVRFETRSTRVKSDGYDRQTYDGVIDHFAVYNPVLDEFYLIPEQETGDSQMTIRYADPPDGYESSVHWHEEYLLDKQLATLRERPKDGTV